MKNPICKYSKLVSCSFLFICSNLFSQSVSSDPVGYMRLEMATGFNFIGTPLVNQTAFALEACFDDLCEKGNFDRLQFALFYNPDLRGLFNKEPLN